MSDKENQVAVECFENALANFLHAMVALYRVKNPVVKIGLEPAAFSQFARDIMSKKEYGPMFEFTYTGEINLMGVQFVARRRDAF